MRFLLWENFDGRDAFLFGKSEGVVYADRVAHRSGGFLELLIHLYSADKYSQQFGDQLRHLNILLGVSIELFRFFITVLRCP